MPFEYRFEMDTYANNYSFDLLGLPQTPRLPAAGDDEDEEEFADEDGDDAGQDFEEDE